MPVQTYVFPISDACAQLVDGMYTGTQNSSKQGKPSAEAQAEAQAGARGSIVSIDYTNSVSVPAVCTPRPRCPFAWLGSDTSRAACTCCLTGAPAASARDVEPIPRCLPHTPPPRGLRTWMPRPLEHLRHAAGESHGTHGCTRACTGGGGRDRLLVSMGWHGQQLKVNGHVGLPQRYGPRGGLHSHPAWRRSDIW